MRIKRPIFVAAIAISLAVVAQPRRTVSLSGPGWLCDGEEVCVPHTWNALDGADGSPNGEPPPKHGMSISPDSYVRKAAHYSRRLPDPSPGMRQFVRFEAVSRKAEVYVNGRLAGRHVGAFTAFAFEVTDLLRQTDNVMEVVADNRWDPDVAPLSGDYTLFGGIYRGVEWIETPPVCIDPVTYGACGVELDVNTNGIVRARIRVLGGPDEEQAIKVENPELWSPENPKLYEHVFTIASGDSVKVRFGFRTVEFREDGFYLNGEKRRLRGVNRHQDSGLNGWAASPENEDLDFALIDEVGADAVRLAHYPQSAHVYDICDERGLLVWSEAPAINWLSRSDAFRSNLLQQAREMVAQNMNHPCVFAWSLFNEIYNDVPEDRSDEGWMEDILQEVRREIVRVDPTRPVVAASDRPMKRTLNDIPDQLAFNAYPGWYGDTTMEEDISNWFAASGRRVLGISEYGAGGNPFEHLDPLPVGRLDPGGPIHPEETQVKLHADDLRVIQSDDRIWGSFIWAMFDFAADARREGGKNGINDKGIVTRDRSICKDVFHLYKANWSGERVLHMCSQRMTETTNAFATVVGISNCDEVTLVLNGSAFGTRKRDEVCVVEWRNVPLVAGENTLVLHADGLSSSRRLVYIPPSANSSSVPSGVEEDACALAERQEDADVAFESPHVKVTAWDLADQTDAHNELVTKREWLLMPGEAPFELSLNVIDVMETQTGRGVVFVRKAPLPHARSDRRPDFRIVSGRPHVVKVLPSSYPCERISYEGGVVGRHRALMAAERSWRAYVPGRDGLLLSNTWGDRARDAHLNEKFILGEIAAAADIGVDVVQIDDGWQKGRSANSVAANGKGVWDGYWATDPSFWDVDDVRFPNGLGVIASAAKERGISLGLWFGPDSSDEAANWERDADILLKYWRDFGVRHYKIDSMKSRSALALKRQSALFDRVLKESGGDISFDLDVTAEIRPGYFGMPGIGPVFVENRYTDWGKYWPHQTLRNLWSLCEVVDPVRLRMEFLNLERNSEKYGDDSLAPLRWTPDAVFASVMVASPLAWCELSSLSRESVMSLKPIVAKWKRERDRIHSGIVFPVGSRPDGNSWTGFVVEASDGKGGYAILFRCGDRRAEWSLDLDGYMSSPTSLVVLSGKGAAKLDGGRIAVSVPDRLGYLWLRIQ